MPILPREPDVFPPDLFQGDHALSDGCWWAMYTMSRREKELMRFLRSHEIPFYCPLVARKSRSPSGRVRTSHVPLFPSYVFVNASQQQRHQALTSNCISKTIEINDTGAILDDLHSIFRLVESNAPLTQESRIQAGQPVRVISGPFMGIEGTVVSRRGEERLLVSVRFLQQGASVAIEDFQVEPI